MDIVERLKKVEKFFHTHYQKGSVDECWNWLGSVTKTGYGRFTFSKRGTTASRAMAMLLFGKIPDDIQVCHKCDNRRCVNPHHLFLGTARDNARDMSAKNRNAIFLGASNGCSKLSEQDIIAIRSSPLGHRAIARNYGVSEKNIRLIRKMETWGHV